MKVKDAMAKIDELNELYENALKLQDYRMNIDPDKITVSDLEKNSGMDRTLRTFASELAMLISGEKMRLSRLVDNAEVHID